MKNSIAISTTALLFLAAACNKDKETAISTSGSNETVVATERLAPTKLTAPIAEAKIYKLLPGYDKSEKFEASGVYYLDGYFYIVNDNRYKIAKIKSTLPLNSNQNTMLGSGSGDSGFEGITASGNVNPHFYVVEEAVQNGNNYQPRIREYDGGINYLGSNWVAYNFTSANSNKGFEGIAYVSRGGEEFILGLVEGTGKIPVIKKNGTTWTKIAEISLPASVSFGDYSDIALYGDKIAITSQEDALLWVGNLSNNAWTVTGGTIYSFPTGNSQGVVGAGNYVLYGNVEGVSFISENRVVVVSDKAKSDQPAYQTYKDQSVHIFDLP